MLKIDSLSKTYANGVHALNNVSLDIPRGMFGLLGPNGAGKSSLMRTLSTLQEADSGTAVLSIPGEAPIDVLRDKDAVRRRLGYLPQDFGVYPKVSALDLLEHFAVLKGLTQRAQRREVVDGLLQQVNLWDARKRKLGTLCLGSCPDQAQSPGDPGGSDDAASALKPSSLQSRFSASAA